MQYYLTVCKTLKLSSMQGIDLFWFICHKRSGRFQWGQLKWWRSNTERGILDNGPHQAWTESLQVFICIFPQKKKNHNNWLPLWQKSFPDMFTYLSFSLVWFLKVTHCETADDVTKKDVVLWLNSSSLGSIDTNGNDGEKRESTCSFLILFNFSIGAGGMTVALFPSWLMTNVKELNQILCNFFELLPLYVTKLN